MNTAIDSLRKGIILLATTSQAGPELPQPAFAGGASKGLEINYSVLPDDIEDNRPSTVLAQLSELLGNPAPETTRNGKPMVTLGVAAEYDRLYATHTWKWDGLTVKLTTYRAYWEAQK